jgi:hypothetical protein
VVQERPLLLLAAHPGLVLRGWEKLLLLHLVLGRPCHPLRLLYRGGGMCRRLGLVSARGRSGCLLLIAWGPEHRVRVCQLAGGVCGGRSAGCRTKTRHGTDLLGCHEFRRLGQHRLGDWGRVVCRSSYNKKNERY